MEPIISPLDLFDSVSSDIADQEMKTKAGLARQMLLKEKQLIEDIDKLKKEVSKKEKSLKEVQEKIGKFKEGDWSILNQFKANSDKPKDEKEDNIDK